MNFERVLVGVDLEPLSAAVLRRATRLLSATGSLHVVHVVDASLLALGHMNPDATPILELRERLANMATCLLDKLLEEPGLAPGERRTVEVAFGRPADVLLAEAEKDSSDLVVIGAHGKGTLDRLLVGSVAEEVARRNAVPTLVVRAPEDAPESKPERILVAIDPTDPAPSLEVLSVARDFEQRLGAPIEVLYVVAPPAVVGSVYGDMSPGIDATMLGDLLLAAKQTVDTFARKALARPTVNASVLAGSPAREIVCHATPRDLIVCGTHAWGILGRLAFGSVAAKVVRSAPCTVLVVGPRGKR